MARLKGRIAVITGGAKGLGEADARLFAVEGATVVIADSDDMCGRNLADEIGTSASFVHLDVRSETQFEAVLNDVVSRYGRLDILINNAGTVRPGTPETITADDLRLMLAVSLEGVVFGCKHAIPLMAAGGGGSIVNLSSVATLQGLPYSAGYSAAKGAIEAYTRTVAVHCKLNAFNIRCNSVHPGAFETPMLASMTTVAEDADPQAAKQFHRRIAANLGDPRDVANLVLFLASEESSYITGQRFVIDNGDSVTPMSAKG